VKDSNDSVVRELRAVQRYSVSLPVCVTWRAPGAPHSSLNALTRDISTRGMFVVTDAEPPEGDLLEFEINLALDEATPLVVVRGEGRVVRTERLSEQPAGFAVHNVWFRLGEPEQGQALPLDRRAPAVASVPPSLDAGKTARRRGLSIVPPQIHTDSDQGESK
jgi:PilZ domain